MICVNKDHFIQENLREMLKESGHNALGNGKKIIATFVMKTFLDTELLKNIKLEHKKNRNG